MQPTGNTRARDFDKGGAWWPRVAGWLIADVQL